jgi:hypothetical protein
MSPEVQPGPDAIQLHFCQSCGISIPQTDIESARAHAAPGGYICAGCYFQQGARSAAAEVVERKEASGSRALVAIALLYVVGVTTFLLFREVNRQPPVVDLRRVATQPQLEALSRKVDQLNLQTRAALEDLKGNDTRVVENVAALADRFEKLNQTAAELSTLLKAQTDDLRGAILDLANRTVGLRGDVGTVLREVRGLGDRLGELAERGPAAAPPKDKPNPVDVKAPPPEKSKEEIEAERLRNEYIAKLKDKRASNQTRYNAAVQLGDLKHEDSVQALVEALEKDSNDLVRRASAWSLGMLGKLAVPAIPTLIEHIGGREEYVGYMCERALGEITKAVQGQAVTFNFDPTMSQRERRKVQKSWEEWWAKHKAELLPDG